MGGCLDQADSSMSIARYHLDSNILLRFFTGEPAAMFAAASALIESDYLLTLDNEFFKPSTVQIAKERHLKILKPGDYTRLFEI